MRDRWINAGIGPDADGKLVKHPGELWLRDTLDYHEVPRRVVLARNMTLDGEVTESMADYVAQNGFVPVDDARWQVWDLSYEEAYALLPLVKRKDLWKYCDGRVGGLSADEADGKYIEPSGDE